MSEIQNSFWWVQSTCVLLLVLVVTLAKGPDDCSQNSKKLSPTTAGRGGTSIENMKKLNKDLMKDYNRNIRPVKNQEKAIVVRFGVAVVEVADLQPESGRVTIAAWLRMSWVDEMLKWNPKQYGGINEVYLPASDIWLPDIRLYNSLDTEIDQSVSAMVRSNGRVRWITPATYTLTCRHEFRHNAWVCPFFFSSWTYDGTELDILPWDEEEVDFDVEQFRESDYYSVVEHFGQKKLKTFACCRNQYPAMEFVLKLRNKIGPSLLG